MNFRRTFQLTPVDDWESSVYLLSDKSSRKRVLEISHLYGAQSGMGCVAVGLLDDAILILIFAVRWSGEASATSTSAPTQAPSGAETVQIWDLRCCHCLVLSRGAEDEALREPSPLSEGGEGAPLDFSKPLTRDSTATPPSTPHPPPLSRRNRHQNG